MRAASWAQLLAKPRRQLSHSKAIKGSPYGWADQSQQKAFTAIFASILTRPLLIENNCRRPKILLQGSALDRSSVHVSVESLPHLGHDVGCFGLIQLGIDFGYFGAAVTKHHCLRRFVAALWRNWCG